MSINRSRDGENRPIERVIMATTTTYGNRYGHNIPMGLLHISDGCRMLFLAFHLGVNDKKPKWLTGAIYVCCSYSTSPAPTEEKSFVLDQEFVMGSIESSRSPQFLMDRVLPPRAALRDP